ncbi:5'-nucleotidase, lipoprotein e(P4) family [Bacillus salipaludis]|uniref:5'-nucleotidase, lipoprotein e(P4) family n=2 Tax=Bacillus salipaludis TaxID=2547811 RepID=A0AA90TT10_9BACI|nr:5'-nucleotidase, lipoprotein e(P4) family [Bacillus salipaludis]MDQ6596309.1 5'-nucleotidase, lipoprotein e(P4) family [Bacillus salipaludis]
MAMKKFTAFVATAVLTISIFSTNARAQNVADPTAALQDQNTMSVLWFQKAGEAKALYYQGYNVGKMRLAEILKKKPKKRALKPAVVLDIDETILDNSPYQAWNVVTGKAYPLNWNEWINSAQAKPLPGAIDFLKYANSKGVAIYYISNRTEAQKDATIKNLKSVGAPQADAAHVLLKQPGEKGKETRRQQVAKTHNIVLLFGDNLGDFSGFDDLSLSARSQAVDNRRNEFGKKMIVFPNPMYGDWEGAIYNYDFSKSDAEKAKLRKEGLVPYQP